MYTIEDSRNFVWNNRSWPNVTSIKNSIPSISFNILSWLCSNYTTKESRICPNEEGHIAFFLKCYIYWQ